MITTASKGIVATLHDRIPVVRQASSPLLAPAPSVKAKE